MTKWTKAQVRELVNRMRQQGRSETEIAHEIRTETGLTPLAAYRQLHGWSQAEAAARYSELTPGYGVDQATLSRLELWPKSGGRAPLSVQLIAFARLYSASPLGLLTAEGYERLDEAERNVLLRVGGTTEAAPPPSASEWPTAAQHPGAERPVFLKNPQNPSSERQVEMAARRALRFGSLIEGSNTGAETIQALYEETVRIARVYPRVPLGDVLSDLIEAQDVAFAQLEGRQRPSQSKDLYVLAGLLSIMLAKASHDTGDTQSAMKQARTAAICADQSEHPGLMVRVRAQQSLMAYWAGWTGEAARYAVAAEQFAHVEAGSGAVWLAAQEARTWAALGNRERAVSALRRVEELRESMELDDLDSMGGLMHFARCRQEYYDAETRIWIPGEEEEAKRAAHRAIGAYETAHQAGSDDWAFGDEAGARADLAFAHVSLGEVEGAGEALAPVLSLPPAQRIAGVVGSVMRVHAPLRKPEYSGSRTVNRLRDEIEAYAQTPAAALTAGR